MGKAKAATRAFEKALATKPAERYVLRLYVAGTTEASTRAVNALQAICEEHLAGRYELEVIDVYQQPVLARNEQILAVPTLVKHLPTPMRRILGDLSDKQRVLMGLDLKPKADEKKHALKKRSTKARG
jgi:circadian clock protein KaiB